MTEKHWKALELDKILAMLSAQTSSSASAQRALELQPSADYMEVCDRMKQIADMSSLTVRFGTPSLGGIPDCTLSLEKARVGASLTLAELIGVSHLLRTVRQIKDWHRQSAATTSVDGLFELLTPCTALEEDISRAVLSEDELADDASPELASIRRKIQRAQLGIRERLEKIIRSPQYAKVLQEPIVTLRDGRFVVPVKAECKTSFPGLIHDTSSTGATVFIEPMAVVDGNNEIRLLQNDELAEVNRILREFSGRVGDIAPGALQSWNALIELDLLFAKARLADRMKASIPEINDRGVIDLHKARHPLIDPAKVVPVDIALGRDFDTLVITGPNTGGKTVALKTLGLLTLMAACGLMLPVASGSSVAVFRHVLADIGDEQSIEQSLSTFSGHIRNIISILEVADDRSLILTDELGAGTDPVEGAALAVAIIEALRARKVRLAATTHYAEIKMYALQTPGVENGCCEFDVATLSPTYRLLIGVPGRSNAFAISQRLGLQQEVIDRARSLVSGEATRFEDVVSGLEKTRQELENEKSNAETLRGEAARNEAETERIRAEARAEADREVARAREEARTLVERTRSQTDLLLNEMEELKKERDKEDFSARVAELRQGYKGRINDLRDAADPVGALPDDSYVLPRALVPGDAVVIAALGMDGKVLSGPDSSGSYLVQAGIMRTKVKAEDLRLADPSRRPPRGARKPVPGNRSVRELKSSSAREGSTELDLRGMTADEAMVALDRFLDTCQLMNVKQVTIIHGKGTGVLRAAVQQHLHRHPAVRTQRPGMYGEGEAGVTIAELK